MMNFNFRFMYGPSVKPDKGWFMAGAIESMMMHRDVQSLADSLTKEAERVGAEDDPEFAERLEALACKLDDAFSLGHGEQT